jgi:ribosomal protein S19E (S16A)
MSDEQQGAQVQQRHRSPGWPFIPLDRAVARAAEFYKGNRDRAVKPTAANVSWGMTSKSGAVDQTIAALRQYGLIQRTDEGIKITDIGLRIIRNLREISPEREAALRQSALAPKIFADIHGNWPDELEPDATLEFYLVHERGFSEEAAKKVLVNYKASIRYARLDGSDNNPDSDDGNSAGQDDDGQILPFAKPTPLPASSVRIMEGERIVFTHEVEPAHAVRILASGEIDESVLDALELYVQLQKKRLERERLAPKQTE